MTSRMDTQRNKKHGAQEVVEEEADMMMMASMNPEEEEGDMMKVVIMNQDPTEEEVEVAEQLVNLKLQPIPQVQLTKVSLNPDVTFLQTRSYASWKLHKSKVFKMAKLKKWNFDKF